MNALFPMNVFKKIVRTMMYSVECGSSKSCAIIKAGVNFIRPYFFIYSDKSLQNFPAPDTFTVKYDLLFIRTVLK